MKTTAIFALLMCALTGCVQYDLAGAPSKDLGVGHLYERLPATAKVAQFRDGSREGHIQHRLLMRCTDAFTISLKRTDIFERVLPGGGDPAEIGFEGTIERCECRQNYGFIWAFYSFFALIAVPANLPLSIDDADYEVVLRAVHIPSGQTLGTYRSEVHLHSWRGAWSLFETFLEDAGQIFDIANRELLNKVVDDYPKFRAVTLRQATAREEPR
ncbi:MAG: hypothetical protein ACAI25_04885 [Planctomycetota bacterium]